MTAALAALRERKHRGEKIAMLTAYDYPTARLLEEAGVDVLLVGDSVGMVVLGYPDTTHVTMDHMLHHTRAVARGAQHVPIIADLPINSYRTPEEAVENARRLIDAGAHAVKFEGGATHVKHIRALVAAAIPAMAHIGMMPQHVVEEGGYKVKGKTSAEMEALLGDAAAVQAAGAWGILLELVKPEVARQITASVNIPTIGIGAGADCDGQVLVTHDLIGLFPWFTPRFVTPSAKVGGTIREAAAEWISQIHAPNVQ